MKQEVIAGIILCAMGLCLLVIPVDIWWKISEQWKTEGEARPSKRYAAVTRAVGIVFAVAGAALLISAL